MPPGTDQGAATGERGGKREKEPRQFIRGRRGIDKRWGGDDSLLPTGWNAALLAQAEEGESRAQLT